MSQLNIFLYLLVAAVLPPMLITLVLAVKPIRHGRPYGYMLAIACLWVLAIPAGLLQAFHYITPLSDKGFLIRLAVPVLAGPFNIGGLMTRLAFEAQGGSVGIFKDAGAIRDFQYWLPALIFHMGVFGAVFEHYFSRSGWNWKTWPLAVWAAVALANSLANATWPWWGK